MLKKIHSHYIILFTLLLSACSLFNPYLSVLNKLDKKEFDKASFKLSRIERDSNISVIEAYTYTQNFKQDQSPFRNLDSAIHWAHIGDSVWDSGNELKKNILVKRTGQNEPFSHLIRELDSLGFIHAKDKSSEEAMLHYLSNFPGTRYEQKAIHIRDSLAFEKAKNENTYLSYKHFIEKYPNSRQAEDAREVYEFLLYETHTRDGYRRSYENFIGKFPHSPYVEEAQRELFILYTLDANPESFEKYIDAFPNSPKSDEARLWIKHARMDYPEVEPFFFMPQKDFDTYILFNPNDSIIPIAMDSVKKKNPCEPLRASYFIYSLNSRWGLANQHGRGLIPPLFHNLERLKNDIYVYSNESKKGLVHVSGFKISEALFEDISLLNDTFMTCTQKSKKALLAHNGKVLSEFEYDSITILTKDVLALKKNDRWALTKGKSFLKWPDKVKLEFHFDSIRVLEKQSILVFKKNAATLLSFDLKTEYKRDFYVKQFGSKALFSEKDNESFIMNFKGEILFDSVTDFYRNEQGFAYQKDSLWHCRFFEAAVTADSFEWFNTYFLRLYRNDSSFIQTEEAVFSSTAYELLRSQLYEFESDLALCFDFLVNGKHGLLSISGDTILLPEWDEIKVFEQDLIRVKLNGKYALYNSKGERILKSDYEAISNYDRGGLSLYRNAKFGYINPSLNILLDAKYRSSLKLLDHSSTFLTQRVEKTLKLINKSGKEVARAKDFEALNDSLLFFNEDFKWKLMKAVSDEDFEKMDIECTWYSPWEDDAGNRHFLYETETGMGFYDLILNDNIFPDNFQIYPVLNSEGHINYFYVFKYFEEIDLFLLKILDRDQNEKYRVLIDKEKASKMGCSRLLEDI